MSDGLSETLDHAESLIESSRISDAVALLEPLMLQHPESPRLWLILGRVRGMSGREPEAESAFAKAAGLLPEMHEAHLNLALSRVYQGKLREAVPGFVAARRLNPGIPGLDKTLFDILQSILQEDASLPADPLPLTLLGNAPLVSIVVPTRNRVDFLKDALGSIARQTYRNWELVVVNDGGEDVAGVTNTLPGDMAARAKVLRLPTPTGQAHARNVAIKESGGEVLAFLDDDDLYLPNHLQTLVDGLRASGAGFAYTLSEKVNERLVDGKRVEFQRNAVFQDLRFSRELLQVRNFIPSAGWGIRRTCIDRFGLFDETLACLEDWDLLLRLSEQTAFHRIASTTNEIHIRLGAGDSVSTRVPALSTFKRLYGRYPGRGNEYVDLARELHLAMLFGLQETL